jgi:hypothetical protein
MAQLTLEDRVLALERQMATLKAALHTGARPKDWRRTVGMFTGDEGMKRIDEAAQKLRAADRARVARPKARARQAKQ